MDGIIYIYELRRNLNLIRFLKTCKLQIIQNIVVGAMEICQGSIIFIVLSLKEYVFQKVYFEPLTKDVKNDIKLFAFYWAVQKLKFDLNTKMKKFITEVPQGWVYFFLIFCIELLITTNLPRNCTQCHLILLSLLTSSCLLKSPGGVFYHQ